MMYELIRVERESGARWTWFIRNPEGTTIKLSQLLRLPMHMSSEDEHKTARKQAMAWCGERNKQLQQDRRDLGTGKERQKANQERMGRRHHARLAARGLVKP